MSKAIAITDATFAQEVEQAAELTIVDCWATWCGPCRAIAPMLDQIAQERAGTVKVTKLDVDENRATAARFGIRSVPTLLFFKGGTQVAQLVGAVPKAKIEAVLAQQA